MSAQDLRQAVGASATEVVAPSHELARGRATPRARTGVSVIMPAYDEATNLGVVVPQTCRVLEALPGDHEVLVVDDGSRDGTPELMEELLKREPAVRYVRLRRNYGKSTALQTGFERALGDRIVLIDADGQDQPEEIPRLLDALDEGLDLATGRRVQRNDRFVKRHTSRLYNAVTSAVTGVDGEDFNSGLKAMRRQVMEPLVLYGELHRYIPVLAHWAGFSVGEVAVEHRRRLHGVSKFGRARFWRGFLDLLTVKFLTTYTGRPFHLFGGAGSLFGFVGVGLLGWMLIEKIMGHAVGNRPALLAGILLIVVGVQLMSVGLIGELIVHFRRGQAPVVLVEDDASVSPPT